MGRRRAAPAGVRERRAVELAWSERRGRSCLRLRGLPDTKLEELRRLSAAELARRVAVFPSELLEIAAGSSVAFQPIAGELAVDGDSVCFTPRFPFVDGTPYTVGVDGERWTIERARRDVAPETEVVAIYPSASEIPFNQLKLYVLFSAAMSEGSAVRAVNVLRADDGEPLEGVLLALELWDQNRTRLTLLLDPGRIKRGLAPHEQAGYPLEAGVPVLVRVDESFRDAQGRALRAGAMRQYEVGDAVRSKVDPRAWSIHTPTAGSREPITLGFDRPLDRALLEHGLSVCVDPGSELAGCSQIGPGESSWQFVPALPWQPGSYGVRIEARLEDLAGNSLIRVFDRDLSQPQDDPLQFSYATLRFRC